MVRPEGRSLPFPIMSVGDLSAAASAIEPAGGVVDRAIATLAAAGGVDAHQMVAYDLAHAAAAVETGRALLDYGGKGEVEAPLTCAYVADAVPDLPGKPCGRGAAWGVDPGALDACRDFLAEHRDPSFLAGLAADEGPRHLD